MTTHTEQEILSQPEVWQQTIDALDPMSFVAPFGDGITDVVVTGCGSTHYLALSAAALLREAGLRAWALPASELIAQAQPRSEPGRHGAAGDLALGHHDGDAHGGRALPPDRRAIGRGDHQLPRLHAGLGGRRGVGRTRVRRASVAQTRSFTSMQVIVSAIAGALGGADLAALHALPSAAATMLARSAR